jgi:hypothetical protein
MHMLIHLIIYVEIFCGFIERQQVVNVAFFFDMLSKMLNESLFGTVYFSAF